MYENEEVDDDEGKKLAKELGAIFQGTSAKESTGVEDLFLEIAKRFINPNSQQSGGQKGQKLNPNSGKNNGGKKGCC